MVYDQQQFVDEYSNIHDRTTVLGQGGQGVVFRTKDPDVAVKIALDGDGRPVPHASYVKRLRCVRALPVPAGLNLATPMAVLRGNAGYAMRLLQDMQPFSEFWPDHTQRLETSARPTWLASLPEDLANDLLWYRDSGASIRRLTGLYKCAVVLARLHGAGLVYGDVSPTNAFIPKDHLSREVWLIDADNLRYETENGGPGIYTPQFGAPELLQRLDGSRQRTDCHAFAVMAFSMMTLLHPYIGALVESGVGGDWANNDTETADLDEQAYSGRLPWIFDQQDDSNRKDNGLIELVLTDELIALFQATFGPGRTHPWLRPSMFSWPKALARAADQTILCDECKMSHFFDFEDLSQRCPYCEGLGSPTIVATAFDWQGQPLADSPPTWRLAQNWRSGIVASTFPHRLFYPFSLTDGDRDVLALSLEKEELRLTICDGGRMHHFAFASNEEGSDGFKEFEGTAAIPRSHLRSGFWIRVEGQTTRLVRFMLKGDVV